MINEPIEDYIKGIFILQQKKKSVTTSELARYLGLADASVTDMVKKLSTKKLLRHTPYRGVELTDGGKRLAVKMTRRHRLWEMFLVKFLSYTWDEVHEEAEKFEHIISDEMERRLDKTLGYPRVDPHGDPIPTAEGKLELQATTALGEFNPGDTVEIVRVSDHNSELLQHATKLGFALKTKIMVKEKLGFDGSMVVKVGKKEQFISKDIANSIFVELV